MCRCSHGLYLLIIFTLVYTLIFLDRGVWSVTMVPVQEQFKLTNTQVGIVGGVFMIGYTFSSILFAYLSSRFPPLLLMAVGVGVWILASICCGLSFDLWTFLLSRIFVGVGEAAYLVLAPPLLDAIAPVSKRTQWIGFFFLSLPIGYALGNALGGLWMDANIYKLDTWRLIYLGQAAVMLPLFFITLFSSGPETLEEKSWILRIQIESELESQKADGTVPLDAEVPILVEKQAPETLRKRRVREVEQQTGMHKDEDEAAMEPLVNSDDVNIRTGSKKRRNEDFIEPELIPFWKRLGILCTHLVFMSFALGYAAQTFVIGGIATYTISYQVKVLNFSVGLAGATFGVMTLVMGVVGIWFGGWFLDFLRSKVIDNDLKSSQWAALQMLVCVSLSLPFAFVGFAVAPKYPYSIFGFLAPAEFLMFATVAPVSAAFMWCVDLPFRSLAVAFSAFLQHLLGDALSPIIIGVLIDTLKDMTLAMTIACTWLGWTIFFWALAWQLLARYNNELDNAMLGSQSNTFDFKIEGLIALDNSTAGGTAAETKNPSKMS